MEWRYRIGALLLTLSLGACGGSGPGTNTAIDVNADAGMSNDLGSVDNLDSTGNLATIDNLQNVGSNGSEPATEQAACATPPASGALLEGRRFSGRGHLLEIRNGAGGDAIVKVRDAASGRLVISFFVSQGTTASISGIPDGEYRIQYAFGAALAEGCRSFIRILSASEFPQAESMVSDRDADGNPVNRLRLSYTLYSVPDGNTHPTPIDPATFDR